MKIGIAQQNYHIGNFESNLHKIKTAITDAQAEGADLIVFSELAVCGYPPRDFLEFDEFLNKCYQSITAICAHATNIAVLVGCPAPNPSLLGKNLFNGAYFINEGKVEQVIHKALLPTYDVFDEYRYFEPGFEFKCIELKGQKIAVTICEDIWDMEVDPVYRFRPMDLLMEEKPSLMINLSASPFDYNHAEKRRYIVGKNATHYGIPMVYCNTVGSQTEIVFDGGSMVVDAQGAAVAVLPYFQEGMEYVTWDGKQFLNPVIATDPLPSEMPVVDSLDAEKHIALIHQALVMGIRQYFEKMGFEKAVVASSGGIDSALVLALACEALGSERVHALLMPSEFSTGHSVDDAVALSQNLNNRYDIIPIQPIFEKIENSLESIFEGLPFDVAEENIQSRTRGLLVMALANKFNYILLNTSNKSELATGYGTLYGDMAGGIGVLGDLYKTQVYALARYVNRDGEVIPEHILSKPPSAELSPDQLDSDSLPPYALLDGILYQYIERRQGVDDIVTMGYDRDMVVRIVKMMNRNEYKRNQFCPIIRVSSKAFGVGRRIPIVAKYEV